MIRNQQLKKNFKINTLIKIEAPLRPLLAVSRLSCIGWAPESISLPWQCNLRCPSCSRLQSDVLRLPGCNFLTFLGDAISKWTLCSFGSYSLSKRSGSDTSNKQNLKEFNAKP